MNITRNTYLYPHRTAYGISLTDSFVHSRTIEYGTKLSDFIQQTIDGKPLTYDILQSNHEKAEDAGFEFLQESKEIYLLGSFLGGS